MRNSILWLSLLVALLALRDPRRVLGQGGDLFRGQLGEGLHRAALAPQARGVADDLRIERRADVRPDRR